MFECCGAGLGENRAQFHSFASKICNDVNGSPFFRLYVVKPQLGFVGLLHDRRQPGREFLAGSAAAGGAMIGCHSGARSKQLLSNHLRENIAPQIQAEIDDIRAEQTCAIPKLSGIHAGDACKDLAARRLRPNHHNAAIGWDFCKMPCASALNKSPHHQITKSEFLCVS